MPKRKKCPSKCPSTWAVSKLDMDRLTKINYCLSNPGVIVGSSSSGRMETVM